MQIQNACREVTLFQEINLNPIGATHLPVRTEEEPPCLESHHSSRPWKFPNGAENKLVGRSCDGFTVLKQSACISLGIFEY